VRDLGTLTPPQISDCDSEPIDIPGRIQSHGFLIALDAGSGCSRSRLRAVHANADAIGKPFSRQQLFPLLRKLGFALL
jgi:light-regulated signal transduction histidine kinase (bacteriophytochrome)